MILLKYIIFVIFVYLIFRKEKRLYAFSDLEYCKSCGEVIDPKSIYCPNCNDQNKKICDECGSIIDIEWRYCPFCDNTQKVLYNSR